MKVYWNYLSVLTKEHIQSALIVSLPLMSDQALAETIKGLGGMRVPLSDFSVELKDTLTNCVNKCCHRVKTEHLTDIIFGYVIYTLDFNSFVLLYISNFLMNTLAH